MGFICLYVLIQKSGQKTAKSHLCALARFGALLMTKKNFHLEIPPATHCNLVAFQFLTHVSNLDL